MQLLKPLIVLSLLVGSLMAAKKDSFLPKTFHAKYVKEEKSVISQKIMKSEGNLYYQYPGRIRLESKGDNKTVYVANPFQTYLYTPPAFEGVEGELTISKSKNTPITKFFDSLKKGLNSNDLYNVDKKSGHVDLKFTKTGLEQMKIKSAQLFFDKKVDFSRLKKIKITLDNNKLLTYKLEKIKTNLSLKKDLFDFEAPKGTRVFR